MATFSQFEQFEALPVVETKYFTNPAYADKISAIYYSATPADIQEILTIANKLDGHRPPQQTLPHSIKYFNGDK